MEWYEADLFPRVGFIVTSLNYPPKGIVAFTMSEARRSNWSKKASRPELNRAVLPQVRGQRGHGGTLGTGLQPGPFHEKSDLCGGDEPLVADQSADLDDQARRAVGVPYQKAGVSAC